MQDIATILSAPVDELPDIAVGIAERGVPLNTLVLKVIQQLYPLRDDTQRRNKSEREKVLGQCNIKLAALEKGSTDVTRASAVFVRAFDGPSGGLLLKLTQTFSSKYEKDRKSTRLNSSH